MGTRMNVRNLMKVNCLSDEYICSSSGWAGGAVVPSWTWHQIKQIGAQAEKVPWTWEFETGNNNNY